MHTHSRRYTFSPSKLESEFGLPLTNVDQIKQSFVGNDYWARYCVSFWFENFQLPKVLLALPTHTKSLFCPNSYTPYPSPETSLSRHLTPSPSIKFCPFLRATSPTPSRCVVPPHPSPVSHSFSSTHLLLPPSPQRWPRLGWGIFGFGIYEGY